MVHQQNEGTSCQPPELKPCANNCGFWGRSDTMNLCSKCYRDFQNKEHQAALAKAAMEKSFTPETSRTPASSADPRVKQSCPSPLPNAATAEAPLPSVANRCRSCNRKVGLTGFKCRCGLTFCGNHRYAEMHGCTFDFKSAGRDAIAKANPVVKADKLERI